ncbi:hypothetical protein RRG08_022805 [Elysia crispata]|uniref:PiggyBac transposable element-derived protein domain-containing protein n=1 Tax=Elysia crispata TaxID=231223 RepID=A0AAE0Z0M9_9GAST|nr:hypothetical protein RRG08_022805 [Elysia crispata]
MHGDVNLSNKPFDVVHRLMEPLLNFGHCLYVDNYYCNPALCDSLVKRTIVELLQINQLLQDFRGHECKTFNTIVKRLYSQNKRLTDKVFSKAATFVRRELLDNMLLMLVS